MLREDDSKELYSPHDTSPWPKRQKERLLLGASISQIVMGRDIVDAFPFPSADDEEFLAVIRPKELGRPVVVEGSSVVAYFAFNKQRIPHEGRALPGQICLLGIEITRRNVFVVKHDKIIALVLYFERRPSLKHFVE